MTTNTLKILPGPGKHYILDTLQLALNALLQFGSISRKFLLLVSPAGTCRGHDRIQASQYITGVVMEALFKVRYWDYSNQKFNFQGHVCLSSSLAWGMRYFARRSNNSLLALSRYSPGLVSTIFLILSSLPSMPRAGANRRHPDSDRGDICGLCPVL